MQVLEQLFFLVWCPFVRVYFALAVNGCFLGGFGTNKIEGTSFPANFERNSERQIVGLLLAEQQIDLNIFIRTGQNPKPIDCDPLFGDGRKNVCFG